MFKYGDHGKKVVAIEECGEGDRGEGEGEGEIYRDFIKKMNELSKLVPKDSPQLCQFASQWDSITFQTWIDQNVSSEKVRKNIQVDCSSTIGAEPSEVSFLFFLWYVHQNTDFDSLLDVVGGLQEY